MMTTRRARVWNGSAWEDIAGSLAQKVAGVPLGTVVAYSGTIDAVPAGWLPCDGRSTAGTALASLISNVPDLRARFILGADPYNVAQTGNKVAHTNGGSQKITVANMPSHNHGGSVTGGDHTHVYNSGNRTNDGYGLSATAFHQGNVNVGGTDKNTAGTGAHSHVVNSQGNDTDYWPRYYALVYIIRSELTQDDVADLAALDARYALKSAVPMVASGNANNGTGNNHRINFGKTFPSNPIVTCTFTSDPGDRGVILMITSVDTTGFTLTAFVPNVGYYGNKTVNWIAVEKTP